VTIWPRVQLRHIAHLSYGDSLPDASRRDGQVPVYGSNGAVGTHDQANTQGPVLVVGRKGSHGKVQFSFGPVFAIDTTYFIDETTTKHDLRWLYYALSILGLDQISSDVGVPGLSREAAYAERVPLPPIPAQSAIADFLDVETARIDALLAKKHHMRELVQGRRWTAFLDRVDSADAPTAPLRRALRFITDGPFGSAFTSDEYTDSGLAVVRLGNIGFAEFRGGHLAYLDADRLAEFSRYRVRFGDVLFAGLGDERNHAGRACVAPDLGPAIVKGKCFCARLDLTIADPAFVALCFSSPRGAEAVAREARGSTRSMINLEIVKSVHLPLPDVPTQRQIVVATRQDWARSRTLRSRLDQQINLLTEHRQALITAAVTGELELPGVAA
jgi:type I restriction enzyme S subunit